MSPKALSVLFLATSDLESPAGLGRYGPMARALVRQGLDVSIATLHPDFPSLERTSFEDQGVRVYYVAPMHVMKRGARKTYYPAHQLIGVVWQSTFALLRASLSIPADIIHIGKPYPMNGIPGIVGRFLRNKKVVLDCDDYEAAASHFTGAWQKVVVAFFENNLPRLVNHTTTHTRFLLKRLVSKGIPVDRITYVPNGVDRQRFYIPETDQVKALKSKLGLHNKKVVGFIGSLSFPSHPLDLLLQAFGRVHQILPDSRLFIVGGGEAYDTLETQTRKMGLEPFTLFGGRIRSDLIPLYYKTMDLIVDPVYDDDIARARCPLKLFESWASGVPFITGDVGDRDLLLGSPPAGILVDPGNPSALADGITALLEDRRLAIDVMQRGQERVKQFYWDVLAKKLADLYQGLTAQPNT
jgi:glycosyltransferase involved in cell wall biosynthesis